MSVVHFLVGYDRHTEELVAEHQVPRSALTAAKRIAEVAPEDPDAVGNYPLTTEQAKAIAAEIGVRIDAGGLLWYLEPIAEDPSQKPLRSAA